MYNPIFTEGLFAAHKRGIQRMGVLKKVIAVIGAADCDVHGDTYKAAFEVGGLLADNGCVVVTGGLGGVMEAASKGAAESGGGSDVVGIVPGASPSQANRFVTVAIATGMGDACNAIIANTAHGFIAVGGSYGTLSEIAFALKRNKPIVHIGSWGLDETVQEAATPADAVELVLAKLTLPNT